MTTEFEWPLEKIINGLLASTDVRFRKPSMSRRFTCTTTDKIESVWHMELKNIKPDIELKLCISTATANHFLTDFEITLVSQDDLVWASCQKRKVFNVKFKPDYCINPFICKNALQYLHEKNHAFKIICRIKLQLLGCKVNSVPLVVPDFENLMYDTEFSDLTLIASQKEFKVHKNILATRSKVFSNVIKQIVKERKESIIVINDFDAEVIQELIRYMYCGRVGNLSKLSKNLLEAAEKYDIEGLKIICLEDFCKKMNVENSCKLLQLLDYYKVDDLKSQVLDFVVYNLLDISKSDFSAFNKSLIKEIFLKVVTVYVEDN